MTLTTNEMNAHIDNETRTAGKAAAWCNEVARTLDDEILADRSRDISNTLHQAGIQLQTEAGRFYRAAEELFDKARRAEHTCQCPSIPLHYRVVAGKLDRHADELRERGDALRDAQLAVRSNMVRPVAPQLA